MILLFMRLDVHEQIAVERYNKPISLNRGLIPVINRIHQWQFFLLYTFMGHYIP